jgi:hypothetical protein
MLYIYIRHPLSCIHWPVVHRLHAQPKAWYTPCCWCRFFQCIYCTERWEGERDPGHRIRYSWTANLGGFKDDKLGERWSARDGSACIRARFRAETRDHSHPHGPSQCRSERAPSEERALSKQARTKYVSTLFGLESLFRLERECLFTYYESILSFVFHAEISAICS